MPAFLLMLLSYAIHHVSKVKIYINTLYLVCTYACRSHRHFSLVDLKEMPAFSHVAAVTYNYVIDRASKVKEKERIQCQ